MKKAVHQKQSAQMLLVGAFARFFLNLSNLKAFVGIAGSAIEKAKDPIREEWRQAAKTAVSSQEFDVMLDEYMKAMPKGIFVDFHDALAARSLRLARQTVDTAGIIFAHSLLDSLLSECCQISFVAKPSDWFGFIDNRKVDLKSLKTRKPKALLHESAQEFVRQLSRESMSKRLEYLNKVCAPKLKSCQPRTAWIPPEQLQSFDNLRHRIIHGKSFTLKIKHVEQQMQFALSAGMSALFLIEESYRLLGRKDFSSVSIFRIMRVLAIAKREFPEIFELIEKYEPDFSKAYKSHPVMQIVAPATPSAAGLPGTTAPTRIDSAQPSALRSPSWKDGARNN